MTGVIQFISNTLPAYSGIEPLMAKAMRATGATQVIDLCSGSGGPWRNLLSSLLAEDVPIDKVVLTDLFPDVPTLEAFRDVDPQRFDFVDEPVDATNVSKDVVGFRTLFAAFHHFRPEEARIILLDAVRSGSSIGVYEMSERAVRTMVFMGVTSFLWPIVATPFLKPFRWSNIFWTYVIPAGTLVTFFDGIISCLRTYSPEELQALVDSLDIDHYEWIIGKERMKNSPIPVTYLVGYPKQACLVSDS